MNIINVQLVAHNIRKKDTPSLLQSFNHYSKGHEFMSRNLKTKDNQGHMTKFIRHSTLERSHTNAELIRLFIRSYHPYIVVSWGVVCHKIGTMAQRAVVMIAEVPFL